MANKTCEQCGKEYKRYGSKRQGSAYRFCSRICYWDSMKKKEECTCKVCDATFTPKSHVMRMIYCSRTCMSKDKDWIKKQSLAKIGKEAWNKGKPNTWTKTGFHLSDETKEKISIAHKGKPSSFKGKIRPEMRGENNPNWKGGLRGIDYLERRRFRYMIQKKVFERDNYTCQICGVKGDLQVDHIQPWAEYVELRFCIDNCRTLCAKCHYKVTFGKPMPPTVRAWGHNFLKGGNNL